MSKKIIITSGPPRSGGKASVILDCFKKSKNLFLWPYEIHYFKLFNQASNNSTVNKISKLNDYFLENSFKKFFHYVKNNKLEFVNIDKFVNKIYEIEKNVNSFEYLEHICCCMNDSGLKKRKFEDIDYLLLNTTARGFNWELDKKKVFFLRTNRDVYASFNSLKNKNLESMPLENFFALNKKKSFFYWLHTYKEILNKLKDIPKDKIINLEFEDINFSPEQAKKIQINNCKILNNKFNLNITKDDFNYYYSINRKKIKRETTFSKIELYCLEYSLKLNKKFEIYKYIKKLINIIFEIKFLDRNFFLQIYLKSKIILNFLIYIYIYQDNQKILKKLEAANPEMRFQTIFRK